MNKGEKLMNPQEATTPAETDTKANVILEPEEIANGDPLLKWFSQSKISPILFGFIYTVLLNCLRLFAAWKSGYLHTSGRVIGFIEDPSVYTNFIYGAIVFAYYVWLPRGITTVFKGLWENKVIDQPTKAFAKKAGEKVTYPDFINNMKTWFGQWWWPAISLTISLGVTLIMILPQYIAMGDSAWWTASVFPMITALIWIFVGLYCVLMMLFYTTFSIYWLQKLFRNFETCVRPLYPDKAGGLAPLGNFTLMLSYIIALLGIILVATAMTRSYVVRGTLQFRWTPELLAGLAAYALAAPVAFFGPLSVAHNTMKKAKHKQLLNISSQFDKLYQQVQQDLESDPKKLKGHSEIITELQNFYDMTNKFPVWPFNLQNITRFVSVYIVPALATLSAPLIDWLFSLI
jgi:hypothetical protein